MSAPHTFDEARTEALDVLPAMLTLLRRLVVNAFDTDDPEIDQFRTLLDECVVGAHRLRLREQLRANGACDQGC
jgi:hypothetical protein